MRLTSFFRRLFFKTPPRPHNTGIILGNQATDYFVNAKAGQIQSPIEYKIRLKDGNWQPFAFSKVLQWQQFPNFVDTMSCVSQSMMTAIEAQEFFLTGKQVKYSRRWLAKMSDTTREGNYLYKVADVVRNIGLVLEDDYPTPAEYTWESYYQPIPEPLFSQLKAKAEAWRKKWNFQYEFLQITDPNLDFHLKHSPLVIVIPGHAVCDIYSPGDLALYRDSYLPWDKTYPVAGLQAAMKPILSSKTIMARQVGFLNHPERGMYLPADSMERFNFIKENLPKWMPEYQLDMTKTHIIPCNKPKFDS